jgi:hypothetical protein
MQELLHQMTSEFGFELRLRPLPVPYYVCPICSKLECSWKGDVGSIKLMMDSDMLAASLVLEIDESTTIEIHWLRSR